jgi:hypothetical protein
VSFLILCAHSEIVLMDDEMMKLDDEIVLINADRDI